MNLWHAAKAPLMIAIWWSYFYTSSWLFKTWRRGLGSFCWCFDFLATKTFIKSNFTDFSCSSRSAKILQTFYSHHLSLLVVRGWYQYLGDRFLMWYHFKGRVIGFCVYLSVEWGPVFGLVAAVLGVAATQSCQVLHNGVKRLLVI